MKQFKIRVPESDDYKWQGLHNGDVPYNRITRQEIHELIQKKAVELWYEQYDGSCDDSPYVYLWGDGSGRGWYEEYCNDREVTEITWQDFLKLTPDDVSELPQGGSGVPSLNNTERNELAKELLRGLASCNSIGYDIPATVDYVLDIADEFLKQAGESK